ncbi:MAG TPA: lysylphosphatidylglycerol synthase transmembrane domain-containing protein [Blastocatellia bacterium]|nr:lysylphosphatidylglycerol synthase transmembrane domain-containing protein [Blastocatellia bacterium]
MKKSLFKKLEIASLVAGLALFVYLIKRTGLDEIARYFQLMGWGFALILALSGVRNLLRAGSWFFSIDPRHRALSFWSLTNVMLAGEAIKYLTATGPLLGEPAKAAMVRRQVPLLAGFSSIVVENLIYNLSVALFMFAGLPALAMLVEVPDRLKTAGYVFAAATVVALFVSWLAIRGRWYVFARVLERWARARAGKSGRIEKAASRTRSLEESIYSFYEQRRGAFFLILGLNMAAHLVNVIEVYVILALIEQPASLSAGFVVESVTKIINAAFFFVPTRAGVYESGNEFVLQALGMSTGAGVALAIIRKLRAFAWAGYGLAVILMLTVKDRRAEPGDTGAGEGIDKSPQKL